MSDKNPVLLSTPNYLYKHVWFYYLIVVLLVFLLF
jgi:hypothetical protein